MSKALKLLPTDSAFLEKFCNKIESRSGEWFWMPYWFKKVGEDIYEQYSFDKLPQEIKDEINKIRNP